MTPPKFVIVGTGRSGSGYIAAVLTEAGIACGHEAYWNPLDEQQAGLDGDSSWCALALGLEGYTGHIWHQVRHPLAVISSLAKNPTTEGPYRDLQARLMPWQPWDPIEWGMLAYHTYAEAAERISHYTWRLDDVAPALVYMLSARIGRHLDPVRAEAAVDMVPRTVNWHGEGPMLDWVDLPAGGLRDACMAWAKRWGWR